MTREETGSKRDERTMTPAIKTVWWVEGSLLPRRPRRCEGARPAAARLVPTPTGCSRGAEAHRSGDDSRAARCLLACERWLETPGSSSSMSVCGRGRAGGLAGLGEAPSGSSSSRPATSQHGNQSCVEPVCCERELFSLNSFFEAFDGGKQSCKADMAYRSRAHRHPAHPPPPRAPHPGREKGE